MIRDHLNLEVKVWLKKISSFSHHSWKTSLFHYVKLKTIGILQKKDYIFLLHNYGNPDWHNSVIVCSM